VVSRFYKLIEDLDVVRPQGLEGGGVEEWRPVKVRRGEPTLIHAQVIALVF
jgi:hypothetical protein